MSDTLAPLKIGDVVRVRGGPRMLVVDLGEFLEPGYVVAAWLESSRVLGGRIVREAGFKVTALERCR